MTDSNELRHPDEWAAEQGITIHDADGWRGSGGLPPQPYDTPLSLEEFNRRVIPSTIGPIKAEGKSLYQIAQEGFAETMRGEGS